MNFVYQIRDQILEHSQGFFLDIYVTSGQLDPFWAVPIEDIEGGSGASNSALMFEGL